MSHIIGRGRYARTTYPQSAAAGGGGGTAPLSRQRFIDGGTVTPGPGAATAPFKTIAAFIASRTNVSAQDAVANYVGWLMPSLDGYTEDVAFPPYASTELRADSLSLPSIADGGVVIDGDMTWANVAGAHAGAVAVLALHNIPVTGDLTVTDDGGAPASAIVLSGDELGNGTTSIGTINCRSTVALGEIFVYNAQVRTGINADNTRTDAANVTCVGGNIVGPVAAKSFSAVDASVSCPTIDTFSQANFDGTSFGVGTNPILTTPFADFDGSSWISFLNAGGTRGVGTVVIVEGGASGALVEGAALPATGAVNVSVDGTGATAGYTGTNCGNHYSTPSPITGDVTVTLKIGGALKVGDTMLLTKSDLSAHLLVVHNNAGAQIATVPSANRGFVLARYNGTDWVFVEGGALAA